jgi:hypothetical protein
LWTNCAEKVQAAATSVSGALRIWGAAKIMRTATKLRAAKIFGAVMVLRAATHLREWPRTSPRRRFLRRDHLLCAVALLHALMASRAMRVSRAATMKLARGEDIVYDEDLVHGQCPHKTRAVTAWPCG